jgi:hypothetical protein
MSSIPRLRSYRVSSRDSLSAHWEQSEESRGGGGESKEEVGWLEK